jgi:hypothetical protein
MNAKTYFSVTGVIFLIVALVHALRLWRGWELMIGGYHAPAWVSVAGFGVAIYLGYAGIRLRQGR